MKTKNLSTLLELAAALGFLGFVLGAGAYPVPAPQQAAAAKAAFSKAPLKIWPPAGIRDSGHKKKEVLALASAGMAEKNKGEKLATQRVKRVSRLREPGEAMGGGREKHLKEDAKMSEAKASVEPEAN